jgi:hypothetical protein
MAWYTRPVDLVGCDWDGGDVLYRIPNELALVVEREPLTAKVAKKSRKERKERHSLANFAALLCDLCG